MVFLHRFTPVTSMKLVDKLSRHSSDTPYFSLEFFPPRTEQGFSNLLTRINGLANLKPIAVSITWGAGGSTRDRSLELAGFCQAGNGLDTILHLTCTNMEKGLVDEVLTTAMERGISTILALRGDPPRGEEYWIPTDPRFQHAEDLVTYIKQHPTFSSHFCIGVAGYPDGHSDGGTEDEQLTYLKRKVDAGAEFIVTQLFYDVHRFKSWLGKVRARGITVPIIPGVMPLQTYAMFTRMTALCNATVPEHIQTQLDAIKHDDQLVKEYGVNLAVTMIRSILSDGDVKGVHFGTLNLEKSVRRILDELGWTHVPTHSANQIITDTTESPHVLPPPPDSTHPVTFTISPAEATQHATSSLAETRTGTSIATAEALVRGWDDFPNGRFGDAKSPAFGNVDPWDGGGLGVSPRAAIAQWGHPTTQSDLTSLFLSYLRAETSTTPFSPTPLSTESESIISQLVALTSQALWTVASQPAVDAVLSSDPVVGWGPRGGRVFQKAFVEFFCEQELVGRLDDAFMIWNDFGLCYPPDSPSRKLIEEVTKSRWLVSIVHHDYKNQDALWEFLKEHMKT
ncbi:hypothetical protein FRC07_007434 [Ceratobasidium sp. 392]|nr:hypothetical protein FRC07_007434 [Ceratobasidium sp. 392]